MGSGRAQHAAAFAAGRAEAQHDDKEGHQRGQQPEGEVKGGTSHDDNASGEASQSGGTGNGSIPDTAVTSTDLNTGLGGILAAIGVLLIVIAHAGTWRERHLPTA